MTRISVEADRAFEDFHTDLASLRRKCFRDAAIDAGIAVEFGDDTVAMRYADDVADGRRPDTFGLTSAAEQKMPPKLVERSRPANRPKWVGVR